ncbi:MAG: cyclase family protein [Candidatus Eisenbacteria bacterium]|nr:cyclase family protein [Candidatus Eisenbacteria bacterium]
MTIHDITRPLGEETAPWPGDTPFSRAWAGRIPRGDHSNVSALSFSPHLGTHVDAPFHVREEAPTLDRMNLEPFLGPARVIDVEPGPDGAIGPEALAGIDPADPPRLLFRTGTHPDTTHFPTSFAYLAPETAEAIVRGGARLVGMDSPSLDPFGSDALVSHKCIMEGGLYWIENLDLSRVSAGIYRLIALPLRITGGDASPVRAVLVSE